MSIYICIHWCIHPYLCITCIIHYIYTIYIYIYNILHIYVYIHVDLSSLGWMALYPWIRIWWTWHCQVDMVYGYYFPCGLRCQYFLHPFGKYPLQVSEKVNCPTTVAMLFQTWTSIILVFTWNDLECANSHVWFAELFGLMVDRRSFAAQVDGGVIKSSAEFKVSRHSTYRGITG